MNTLFKHLADASRIHVKRSCNTVLEFTGPMPPPDLDGIFKRKLMARRVKRDRPGLL
jgi:hypothetical protein